MIVADKNLLKASISQGTLRIQNKLIQLYQLNLDSIAVNGALMAIYSFKGFATADFPNSSRGHDLQYFYHPFDVLALVLALFCVSQATIATVFGPTVALTGSSPDAMKKAVLNMRVQQQFCFKIGVVSITCLYVSIGLLCWVKLHDYVSPIICGMLILVYSSMIYYGKKTFDLFHIKAVNLDPLSCRSSAAQLPNGVSEEELRNLINTKAHGVLFWQKPIHERGNFCECYCVLDRGEVIFYKPNLGLKEQSFNKNALNKKPINCFDYFVTTDLSRFKHHFSSLGQTDFSLADKLRSPYNLPEASNKYKFALLPKVSSELSPLPNIILMATDQEAFEQWTTLFANVISAHDEQCRRDGAHDAGIGSYHVESMVEAASNIQMEFQT